MNPKSEIDLIRQAAITLNVGDDGSQIIDMLSTKKALYVIKKIALYKIILADDTDPERLNIQTPNTSQKVLEYGYDDQIIGKVVLTAKYLFDEKNATVSDFVSNLFENCILLSQNLLALREMIDELNDDINQKEMKYKTRAIPNNAHTTPSIANLETKIHNILSKLDKSKDNILDIFRLRFLSAENSDRKIDTLDQAIEIDLKDEKDLLETWKSIKKFFMLVRNARNGIEHQNTDKVHLTNFCLQPGGHLKSPTIEIVSSATPIRELFITKFLDFIKETIISYAETTLPIIKCSNLIKSNPFNEWVYPFPEEKRRHRHVQYYRAIQIGGEWHILG